LELLPKSEHPVSAMPLAVELGSGPGDDASTSMGWLNAGRAIALIAMKPRSVWSLLLVVDT
jgi:hypothetical protein